MSKDAHTSRVQDESNGGPSRAGTSRNVIQVETLTKFMAQCTSMHDACHLVATALEDNLSLTPEQCAAAYSVYGHNLEEALVTRTWAIAQGGQEPNHLPLGPPFWRGWAWGTRC